MQINQSLIQININMRCIEIHLHLIFYHHVLKININMRCIEINVTVGIDYLKEMININMRCIEIKQNNHLMNKQQPD